MRLDIYRFRGDKLDITDYGIPNSGYLLFRGDELDITVSKKENLAICRFRGNMDITD